MRSVLALGCCLVLVSAGLAQEPDQHKKREATNEAQAQHAQQQAVKQHQHEQRQHNAVQGTNNAQLRSQHQFRGQQQNAAVRQTNVGRSNVTASQSNVVRRQARHLDLNTRPRSEITSVSFRENNRIVNSERWVGPQYAAFRAYHAQWHDRAWWRAHHSRVILIGGGWYFWDAGFWYPAWGYDPAYAYYPYDGPIYAYNDLPPDQVIANVQAALQEQGYYDGEIDGLLGPLTRAALADYQRDHDLYTTAAIDEPTLDSLGLS
jgi:Putative peptidoglycan binding domain